MTKLRSVTVGSRKRGPHFVVAHQLLPIPPYAIDSLCNYHTYNNAHRSRRFLSGSYGLHVQFQYISPRACL
jgi:hypothetical protein